ncbi:Octopamine receptor beta-1R [Trichoplax sp. H2]|nr:Octopamine receptor beta-1R [Trichoplax sp. H2]|eukprot:RDD37485.1 Octopamine receptor beta-1R [Trichoplax sp. H2]
MNYTATNLPEIKPCNSCNGSSYNWTLGDYLHLPLFVTGIAALVCLANLVVLLLVLTQKKLRILSNAVLCSSCCGGIIIGLSVLLISFITNFVAEPRQSIILSCTFDIPFQTAIFCIFSMHTALMACERCFSIIYPFKYQRLATKRNFFIILLIAWIIPIGLIYILPLVSSQIYNGNCTGWVYMTSLYTFVGYIMPSLVAAIPIIFTLAGYIIILTKIYSIQRKVFHRISSVDMNPYPKSVKLMLKNKKAIFQMILFLSIYIAFVLPFFLFHTEIVPYTVEYYYDGYGITYYVVIAYFFIYPMLVVFFTASVKEEITKVCKIYFTCGHLSRRFRNRRKTTQINSNMTRMSQEKIEK